MGSVLAVFSRQQNELNEALVLIMNNTHLCLDANACWVSQAGSYIEYPFTQVCFHSYESIIASMIFCVSVCCSVKLLQSLRGRRALQINMRHMWQRMPGTASHRSEQSGVLLSTELHDHLRDVVHHVDSGCSSNRAVSRLLQRQHHSRRSCC